MAAVLESALRGSQRTVPGGFRQTANQLEQDTAAPLPGADIERQGPSIETGVPDIDVATFRALTPQQQAEYLGRLGSQETKPLRIGPEPIDMDLFDALTPDQQADYQRRLDSQTSTISTGPKSVDPSGAPVQSQSPYGRATSELGLAEDRARLGAEQSLEDTAEGYDQQSRAYAMHQYQAQARVQKYEQDQAERRAFIESELPRLEKYLEDRSRQQAVNPVASYNESKGFGGRLVNAIAIGLSTLGSGLNGAPNIAWEMIQKEIDGEVLKQRQITENLGQQFMVRRQLYADMLGQFMTPAEAEAATRYALETSALNELRKLQARSQSEEAKNAASMVGTLLEQDRAKQKKASLEGRARRLWQDVPARTVGKPGGIKGLVDTLDLMQVPKKDQFQIINSVVNSGTAGGAEKMNEMTSGTSPSSEAEVRAAEFRIGRQIEVPASLGGGTGYAHIDSEANKIRESLASVELMKQNVAELRKLVRQDFRKNPDALMRIGQLVTDNTFELKNQKELGVLSADDYAKADMLNGKFVGEFGLLDREKALDGIDRTLDRGAAKMFSKMGKSPMMNAPFRQSIREKAVK
jgi:hypothetical protein